MTSMPHLRDHLPFDHPLSPRDGFPHLPFLARMLVHYRADDLWQEDTRHLPASMAALRRKARVFAERYLIPASADIDLAPHPAIGQCHPKAHEILVEAGRQGWLSYFLPPPLGAMDWGRVSHAPVMQCCLVVEEFTRACGGLMLLLSAHHLGVMPLLLSGSPGVLLKFVRPIYQRCQRGDPHLVAFAITEPGAGSDAEDGHGAARYRPGVVATPVPGGYRLKGRKCFISGGDLAQSITVFAALQGEGMESWTCFYVDAGSPGFSVVRTEQKMGMRASGAAELEFNDVFVPDDRIIGGLRHGWALNRATLNASRMPVASMGVGFARAATEAAIDFARSCTLGGKPLLEYQDVQLHLATMVAETRAIRAMVWQEARHAWRPRQLRASACKFHATDRAQKVCEMAMDLMGDRASLHENRVEKIFRDVRLTRIFEGTNQINRLSLIEDWQGELLSGPSGPFVTGV
ncbi:MAG: acyl-CoA dehydrogenase [Telmatospirillum sp.]|nr:acyl-CoA dehydrogenase [Telmatospirillum sp.]